MGLTLMTAPDPIQPAGSTGASPATGGGHPLVTQLLEQAHKGSAQATNELFPIVYEELRTLAARFLHKERDAQTLQATALVTGLLSSCHAPFARHDCQLCAVGRWAQPAPHSGQRSRLARPRRS